MRRSLLGFVLAVSAFSLAACGEAASSDPRTKAPLVRVAVVQEGKPTTRSFTGTVGARVESSIGFRVPGKVIQRYVDAGETVRRGQVLMRVDATDLDLSADAQEAAVDAARARVHQADEQADHLRDLRDSGKVSDEEYDASKADKSAAKAALDAAESQADIAQNSSRYTELTAVADGVVEETMAEPGQVVAAGEPVVRLAAGENREAVIQLPETLRPRIGSTVEASLFGKGGNTVPATLRELSDSADPLTRTFEARYVLTGELANAPIGSTVTIDIPEPKEDPQAGLRVPVAAVLDAGDGPGVWVIDAESKISWCPVSIERVDDESMYVNGDLHQGDRIVALGAHLMRDGELVRADDQDAGATGDLR